MPEAPIGFDERTPPLMFTGRSPSISVTPSSTSRQPSPGSAKPRFSSHIGSNQENGTYISTQSMSCRGLVTPACRYASAAASRPARGSTGSRSADMVGSLRMAVPWTHATGRLGRTVRSLPRTRAQAPSDEGQVSA
jgi:hypothetical protein